jgi:multicomponent Na+:H+ antiporter subunit E
MTEPKTMDGGARVPWWRGFGWHGLALFAVWLVLSGHYDLFHLSLGLLSVGMVLWINRRILPGRTPGSPARRLRAGRLTLYLAWLLWQMVLAGLHVARVVLTPRMPIHPRLIRFTSRQPNEVAQVILGNSITLTPGTLTLEIEGDTFLVHSLTETTAGGLVSGDMQRRVARLYCDHPDEMVFDVERKP